MRVTLLHIASDGNAEIPRALRQECDDIVRDQRLRSCGRSPS